MRVLLALLMLAGCSTRPAEQSDWERQQGRPAPAETDVELPAYPLASRLVEFEKGSGGAFRLFIDPATLSVGKDGVVRYVLVARSSSGAENVTYEALRCDTAEFRFYAFGRPDGTWARSRTGWRPLQTAQTRQFVLYSDYFCPQRVAIRNTAEGVRALEENGHPFAKGFGGDHSLRRD